jgi:hypothetical protein
MTPETRELIALIRRDIGIVRAEGATSVTIASLETLLATVEDFIAKHPNEEIPTIEPDSNTLPIWLGMKLRLRPPGNYSSQ